MYIYPQNNCVFAYIRNTEGRLIRCYFFNVNPDTGKTVLERSFPKYLKKHEVFILHSVPGQMKERNNFLPYFNHPFTRRFGHKTSIIRKGKEFYRYFEGNKTSPLLLTDNPFPNGVTEDLLDEKEYVFLNSQRIYDEYGMAEFINLARCEEKDCFCKNRGVIVREFHVCPICKIGLRAQRVGKMPSSLKSHMWLIHHLTHFPTVEDLPEPVKQVPGLKEMALEQISRKEVVEVSRERRRRKRQEKEISGTLHSLPSAEKKPHLESDVSFPRSEHG